MLKAPHYMKDNILQKSRALAEKQKIMESRKKQDTNRFLLFRYSMKVGLAMCGALAMLFLSSFGGFTATNITQSQERLGKQQEEYSVTLFINKMNYGLREFSNNMVQYADTIVSNNVNNMEDNKNDK
jgi:hypothetical protein